MRRVASMFCPPSDMTKHGREGGEEAPSLLPPSFTSMPDVAHSTIASFLPEGVGKKDSRLRVAEVLRALFESYGDSLTWARLFYGNNANAENLVALLRRQKKLKRVYVCEQETLPAFLQAIAQGCCRGVEMIALKSFFIAVAEERLDILARALEVDGALPAQTLSVTFYSTPGVLCRLTRALVGGALPILQHFRLTQAKITDDDRFLEADMLERRARIPGCRGLKLFAANHDTWFDDTSPVTKILLLRALLPSLIHLMPRVWSSIYDPCLSDIRPPSLETARTTNR